MAAQSGSGWTATAAVLPENASPGERFGWWAVVGRWRSDHLVRNALYLMLSSGLQAGLGFVFWIVVARLFPADEVGAATSLISAATIIAYVSLLGLNSTFLRYLPGAEEPNALITAGLVVVTVGGTVVASGYLLAMPVVAPVVAFVLDSPAMATGFVLLTVAGAVNLMTDSVFIAARRSGLNALLDGGVNGITKILAAVAVVGGGAFGLFGAATSGFVTAGLGSLVLMVTRLGYRPSTRHVLSALRPLLRFSGANYVGNVLNMLPALVVPLIVLNRLGAPAAAYYYVGIQVATLLYAGASAVEQSFLAEGAYAQERGDRLLRRSRDVVMAVCALGSLVLILTGPVILSAFGPDYRRHGTGSLMVLALAALPIGLNHWLLTILRLTGRLRALVVSNAVYAAAICGLAWFLAPHGLVALSSAWLVGGALGAAVAAVSARRVLRRSSLIGPSVTGRSPGAGRSPGDRARVLIVSCYAPPHVGGVEIIVAQQARTLAALGLQVTVVTSRCAEDERRREQIDGYTVVRVPAWNGLEARWGVPFPVWSPSGAWRLARLAGAADVVHVHDVAYLPSMLGVAVARVRRLPLFLTQHVALVEHDLGLVRFVQRVVHRTAGRTAWHRARRITVYNPIVEAFLLDHGVPAEKIQLTSNGIDPRRFCPGGPESRRATRDRYGLPADVPVVLFVGRLVPKKGFDRLVAAAGPGYHVVIAGSGRIPGEVPSGVTFLGPVDREELPALYRAGDIFAFPAVGEMLTLTLQEAMACGLPVMTTAEPAYARYGLDPRGVAFVAPEPGVLRGTLLRLLADPERLAFMSGYSRALAEERFDWQANVEHLALEYERALPDGVPAGATKGER